MWCGDWHQLPQETLILLNETEDCKPYLEEARHLLYALGNEEDANDALRSIRVACLDPYLFGHSFFSKETETWALSSGIYCLNTADIDYSMDVREIILVMDTLAYHISFLLMLCTDNEHMVPWSRMSDEHKVLLSVFDQETAYTRVVSIVRPSSIYGIFRNKLRSSTLKDEQVLGCFLVALKAALAHSSGTLGKMLPHVLEEQKRNEKMNGVKKLKASGNQKFKEGCYEEAMQLYTEAIEKVRYNHLLYSNRAQCSLHLRNYSAAEMDARRTVVLCPNFEKGYYKLVQVYEGQQMLDQAKQVLDFFSKRRSIINLDISRDMCDLQKRIMESSDKLKDGKSTKDSAPAKDKLKNAIPDLLSESDSEEEAAAAATEPKTRVDIVELVGAECQEKIRKASEDLVEGSYRSAFHCYKQVLSAKTDLSEIETVLVKYAAGCACLQLGSLEDLKQATKLFIDIADNHKIVVFPLSYYGLTQAHIRMNRYMEAVPYINKGLDIIKKGIYFDEAITWPGTKYKVEMRDKASLKKVLEEFQGLCKAPPKPDAICRGKNCALHRNIYYTDPDFRGFQQLHCRSKCLVQYHPVCWKERKESTNLTEKGFLGTVCPTPDCKDIIIQVETIEKDGTVGRHFVHSEYDSAPKQKKTKKEKKLEQREMKKRRRCDTSNNHPPAEKDDDLISVVSAGCDSVGSNQEDMAEAPKQEIPKAEAKPSHKTEVTAATETKSVAQEADDKNETAASLPAEDAPYILKREDDEELPLDGRSKKSKEKKKRNRGILTLDVLPKLDLYSEYKERISRLAYEKNVAEEYGSWSTFCEMQRERCPGLDPSRPFFIPEPLRDNEVALEVILQHRSGFHDSDSTWDVRENIYQYLQEYLLNCGPLAVDDLLSQIELNNFDPIAHTLVDEAGGLLNFLLQSMRFYVVDNMVHAYPSRSPSADLSPIDDTVERYSEESCSEEPWPGAYCPEEAGGQEDHSDVFEEAVCDVHQESDDNNSSGSTVRAAINSQLNPQAADFWCRLMEEEMEPKEDELVAVKDNKHRSKNAAVVVHKLLEKMSVQHLTECVVSALNIFQRDLSQEVLKEMNAKLDFCEICSIGRKVDCGLQIDLGHFDPEKEDLKRKYATLQEESARVKEQLDQALDAKCKLQRRFTVEMGQTKQKLDEMTAELQEYKESWKKSKLEMEGEIKKLQQEKQKLKEAKEEGKMCKGTRDDPDSSDALELVRVVAELTKERHEHQELQENFKAFQEAHEKLTERAKLAEVMFLKSAKEWGKERFKTAIQKAEKTLRDVDRMPIQATSDYRLVSEFARGKQLAETYIKEWTEAYTEFEKNILSNVEKIEAGTALSDLPVFHLPNRPEFNYVLPSVPPPAPYLSNGQRYAVPVLTHPSTMTRMGVPAYLSYSPGFTSGNPPQLRAVPSAHYFPPPVPLSVSVPNSSGARSKIPGPPPGMQERLFIKPVSTSSASSMDSMDEVTANKDASRKVGPSEEAASKGTVNGGLSDGENAAVSSLANSSQKASATGGAESNFGAGDHKPGSTTMNFKGPIYGRSAASAIPRAPSSALLQQMSTQDQHSDTKCQGKGDRSERLLTRLQTKFPNLAQEEIIHYLKEVRRQRSGLSGLTITQIINLVTEIIEKERKAPPSVPRMAATREGPRGTLRAMHVAREPSAGPADGPAPRQPRGWALASSQEGQGQWDGRDSQCSICLEELDDSHAQVRNPCGHTFHEKCIQVWYKSDHTCPNCRAHSLPEKDFPTLGN